MVAIVAQAYTTPDPSTVIVSVPARAGTVDGTTKNSDEFIWNLFTQFTAPVPKLSLPRVVFETWASDADVFSTSPLWPKPDAPRKFHGSLLASITTSFHSSIDVPCATPGNAAVGGFPIEGTPTPCISEETKRNRPQFDYIINNNLNTKVGLTAAFKKDFKVTMPTSAISVKGDWIPVQTILQWIPELNSIKNIRKLYYTTISNSVEYGLVALHVSSRQTPNWVWGTFEHQMNPGRCDYIGCFDTFGSTVPTVYPNKVTPNTQYGTCLKTEQLKALMAKMNLSPVWENYCLKSTQVDYSAPDGTPYVLGNSVIEGITGNGTVAASSCIACHVYASFGPSGVPKSTVKAMLPFNPIGAPTPGVLDGSLQFDFMWGVLLAP
ncbi:hypothetical conserved protein [Candidatus Nitrosoglobus terrae]|uniref:Hypothetical conserved protein n=1 Tax=Candidatus Nitrosoglobus terrae TaxID=1630141 RepID=A0A1Q2SL43_9GAMM|nr:hypothetical conserved protein [Candidatus Nitrosoglobus terrae]